MRLGRSQLVVFTLVAGLILATMPALALPTPPPGPFTPHAAIVIRNNAQFNATNGVVAGSGSPGDPFVISGWSIVTSGTALYISNVTASFVIRNNSFVAGVGVQISDSTSVGVVSNNQLVVRSVGVGVTNSDAIVIDNSIMGDTWGDARAQGVLLASSNSRVESNAFLYVQFGVHAIYGSPSILCNDIHDDVVLAGVYLHFTTNATVACNVITQCTLGIKVLATIGSVIVNNTIHSCFAGIDVDLSKDVTITNNTIRFSLYTQVDISISSGAVEGNLIVDGRADAVVVASSPILFANNIIRNHLGVGLWLQTSAADVKANIISRNSVGIWLYGGSVPSLTANVMTNNTVGISIPYGSRQTIVNMSANIVNNINIDGSIVASEKVYYYMEANVQIVGQLRDSGYSAGYYGSVAAEGGVVLYEVDNANIEASVISHANAGVTAINSFNVVVEASVISNTIIGVNVSAPFTGHQTPACAVSVKNSTINVTVDPIATIGVDAHACLVNVLHTNISLVDTGIRFDTTSRGNISGNVITETLVGIEMSGKPGFVTITENALVNNRIGARFWGSQTIVNDNRFERNVQAGVIMTWGAALTFERNNVTLNGAGVIDAGACSVGFGLSGCGSVVARDNEFYKNTGDGLRLNGTSRFNGDVFLANGGTGARLNTATLIRVNATANQVDGATVSGTWSVRDSHFGGNANHGLVAKGTGDIRASAFILNGAAGIRLSPSSVAITSSNISSNFDGVLLDDGVNIAPVDMHLNILTRNTRDAVRGLGLVNATHNYWGGSNPALSVADTIGAFQNGVSVTTRFLPYYSDEAMTTTGPVAGL